MSRILLIVFALAALGASAFDSKLWFEKREVYTREAERLQAAYANCLSRIDRPAETAVVPVETYEDGSLKLVLSARKAQVFFKEGLIWAENVLIRKLEPDGTEAARIEAHRCLIDRNTKNGWIEGEGRILQGKTSFTGTGLYFSSADGYVMSLRNTVIVTTDLKFGGAL